MNGPTTATLLGGRYRLGELLATGGSARVVVALDETLGRRVAVKLVDVRAVEASDPAARERFLREARTSAGFSHPHAIAVYDAGEDAGVLFLVMELVDGPSLADLIAAGPLPVERALRIAEQVLAALDAAHTSGVVHRDVKPANVLITSNGDAKLADFGIAKRFDDLTDSVTRTGFVVGTPRYLAPEQSLGRPVTPATDVYAVGLLLFEMLTGDAPYTGDSAIDAALAHQVAPVPDIRERRADVPPALAAVISRALAKDPADRYATAGAMAAALRRRSTDTRVMPAAALRRHVSPALRRWVVAGLGALLAGTLAAVVVARDDDPSFPSDLGGATTAVTTVADATSPPTVGPTVPPTDPPVAEIVPGFPATDDLGQFLAQLGPDPSVVGPAGEELRRALEQLLGSDGDKQAERARDLLGHVRDWTSQGTLAPEIGAAIEPLLAPLADAPGEGEGNGDGEGNGNGNGNRGRGEGGDD